MSQPGFFDAMASGTELFSSGDFDHSWFQSDGDYGDLGTRSYNETPPKSPLFTPTPSREGTPTPELSHAVLEGADFSELRPRSEEEHTQNNIEPSSAKHSVDSQKVDSQHQCDSEANETSEKSVPTTSDPEKQHDLLYSDYCTLFGGDSSGENELPEYDGCQLDGEQKTNDEQNNNNEQNINDEQPIAATSEDNADDNIDSDDDGSLFGGSSSKTQENNADKINDNIDNDPLFGGFDDSGLGTENDSSKSPIETGNCKGVTKKSLAPAPVANAMQPFRLHLPEPPRVNASNQGLQLSDSSATSTTGEAADEDFEADLAREMEIFDPAKYEDGTALNLSSTSNVDTEKPAVNARDQKQKNVSQRKSNAPSKSPNAETRRRQKGADKTAKMNRPQARGRGRADSPITKLSGPPPSAFQPLDSVSSSEGGKSSKSRKSSHFTWAFTEHVGFGKPGPGNKYRNENSAQNPIVVAGDSETADKTNKEVGSQSQDVEAPVTILPDAIDLTSGNDSGVPVESDKDNRMDGVHGKVYSEDFSDGQNYAQDYQSFSTPAQNHLAPTNNLIGQNPQVNSVSQYPPQAPDDAKFLAPQYGALYQPQIREHSMVETPGEVTYPPNPSYPNAERQFSHPNENFLSSPPNHLSPYGQPIQQTPRVQPLQYSYHKFQNNLSSSSHGQLPQLNQMNDQYDNGLSDGATDSEEENSGSGSQNTQDNGGNAQKSPRKNKPRPCETRAEYGYHRPWMTYDEYKYLFPLAGPRLCFENAIAMLAEEDAALRAREAIPLRQPITKHIKISHERIDALNQLRISNGGEPFKPKLSGVKDPSAFLDAKRKRIEEEQAAPSDYETQEMRPDAKRPRLALAPIQPNEPMYGNQMVLQQDPHAMQNRQRFYLAYRVPQLREKCKALKLSTRGLKDVLVQRLVDHEANSFPATANNSQQENQFQSGMGVHHDQQMPDISPMNGMQAPPVGINYDYDRQQHQGQDRRVVFQDQPLPYAGPDHGMGPSNNYHDNPSTMQYAPATGYQAPRIGLPRYGNLNQQPWNGGHGGPLNNHYSPPAHGASARQESMNAGLGGYGAFQPPMNGGSSGYIQGSLQQPYSVGYEENARDRPKYSAQGFAGGQMHNPPQRMYGTSMRQRPSTHGNGNEYANRAYGTTLDHMSSINPDQNNINQTIANSLGSDVMNWQAGMHMGLSDLNWNGSTQPF